MKAIGSQVEVISNNEGRAVIFWLVYEAVQKLLEIVQWKIGCGYPLYRGMFIVLGSIG